MKADRPGGVERQLRDAAPHALLDVTRALIEERFDAVTVELLLADYAMTRLQPVADPSRTTTSVPLNSSDAGRAFGAQEPHLVAGTGNRAPTVTIHLPMSVRGDRLGVLSVILPESHPPPATVEALQEIADALAHEIMVAERDTDLFLLARRAERLTLAAEMQWQLLPGRSCSRAEYSIGAQLEPAYAIYGDNFDWSASADHLTLSANNGMGEGIEAALLTNLAVNALRNARRAGLSLAGQAALADQAVYGQYAGRQYLAVLLFRLHLQTGRAEVIDAGSPRVWRMRQGVVEPMELEEQLPLGMFEDTVYTPQHFQVEPGDRLLFVSDGVYDVLSPAGERYSERALIRAVRDTRLLPPSQVPGAVLEQLVGHRGTGPSEDDAMVICLDWHGRP
ncbi:PP2C family protein-serine/threonine phosphatase [Streptomyces sp. NPDC058685]|uniref:PP2C family protein-serine/threonine phosphatase n=1 Tax=Streptomyces sp. NPDC058685 TaxID=3346598 RepID=UPI003647BF0D